MAITRSATASRRATPVLRKAGQANPKGRPVAPRTCRPCSPKHSRAHHHHREWGAPKNQQNVPRAAEPPRRDTRRGQPAPNSGAETRPPPVHLPPLCAARRSPKLGGQVAAADNETA